MRPLRVFAIGWLVLCATPQTGHGQWIATGKLVATDGSPGDRLGRHIALTANWVVASAPEDLGSPTQQIYVFQLPEGEQWHKIVVALENPGEELVAAVGIDDKTAAMATFGDFDEGPGNGVVYLFDLDAGEELFRIAEDDVRGLMAAANFGASVALDAELLVVGASRDSEDHSGAAYVFDLKTGALLHRLVALDARPDGYFGLSVAISNGLVLVGAFGDDGACPANPACDSGSAYVFDAATGEQIYKLVARDGAARDFFGGAVAVSGGNAIIGALGTDDKGPKSGSAYVFDLTTGEQRHKLTAIRGGEDDRFGRLVAVSGTVAAVKARNSTHLFDVITGEAIARFGPIGELDTFNPIAIHGDRLVIGAPNDDDQRGAVHIVERVCFDLTRDGTVGSADLLRMMASWGLCPDCPEDLNHDGTVDFADLLGLLSWWGRCAQPGACCLPDGSCIVAATTGGLNCVEQGGIYRGDDTACDRVTCE